jgi:hypothetical protein
MRCVYFFELIFMFFSTVRSWGGVNIGGGFFRGMGSQGASVSGQALNTNFTNRATFGAGK